VTTEPVEIACTLDAEQMPGREAAWHNLLAMVTAREPIDGGVRLTLPHRADLAATAAELATMEVGCCAFFTFRLTIDKDALLFDVTAPPDGQAVIDVLVRGGSLGDAPVSFVSRR
jgi:MerR family copper efflux transcriptional regulator